MGAPGAGEGVLGLVEGSRGVRLKFLLVKLENYAEVFSGEREWWGGVRLVTPIVFMSSVMVLDTGVRETPGTWTLDSGQQQGHSSRLGLLMNIGQIFSIVNMSTISSFS